MRLFGKNSVLERLKSHPETIRRIFIDPGHAEAPYVRKKAQKRGIPVCPVPVSKIQKLARNVNHQGILAEIDDFSYLAFDDLLTRSDGVDALLFLDGWNDPQNLGAIMRSVACLGRFALVLPTHGSVDVTEAALRVACGADNYVWVSKVGNLAQAIEKAKEHGYTIVGTVVDGGEDIYRLRLPFPLGIVLGSENKGLRDVVRKHVDRAVSIPMANARLSLNVAQAATLFCYEIIRQKNSLGQPG